MRMCWNNGNNRNNMQSATIKKLFLVFISLIL